MARLVRQRRDDAAGDAPLLPAVRFIFESLGYGLQLNSAPFLSSIGGAGGFDAPRHSTGW